MPIGTDIRLTKGEYRRMLAAAILKALKDIAIGQQLIKQKSKGYFMTYKSPKGITYPTWSLFLEGVYGWSISKANRFINAAEQQDRLQALGITLVAQPIETLWTCRKIEDKVLIAAWDAITGGDKIIQVSDSDLHKKCVMHESVKERDTREKRVTTRMIESEFEKLVCAINDRIDVTNKKIKKKKGCTLHAEPTYTFDVVTRKVVSSFGVAYETNEWLMHISQYLLDTNHL